MLVEALPPAGRLAVLRALRACDRELELEWPVTIESSLLECSIEPATKMHDRSLRLRYPDSLSTIGLVQALNQWGLVCARDSAIADHVAVMEVAVAVDWAVRHTDLFAGNPYFASARSVGEAAEMGRVATRLPVEDVIVDLAACDLAYRLPLAGKFAGCYASQYQCRANFWARQYVMDRSMVDPDSRFEQLCDCYAAHLDVHRDAYAAVFASLRTATDRHPSGQPSAGEVSIAFAL
jgi:hypothetical protein